MADKKIISSGSIGNPHQSRVKPDDTRRQFNLKKKGKK